MNIPRCRVIWTTNPWIHFKGSWCWAAVIQKMLGSNDAVLSELLYWEKKSAHTSSRGSANESSSCCLFIYCNTNPWSAVMSEAKSFPATSHSVLCFSRVAASFGFQSCPDSQLACCLWNLEVDEIETSLKVYSWYSHKFIKLNINAWANVQKTKIKIGFCVTKSRRF